MPSVLSWSVKPPAKLAVSVQPLLTAAGSAINSVVILVTDEDDNLLTSATNEVTLSIGTNPSGGTLSGTVVVNAIAGIATFSTLNINKMGVGYTLVASSAGLTPDTTDPFTITYAAAALMYKVSGDAQQNPITAPFVVLVTDNYGNPVPNVTVTFAATVGGGSVLPLTDDTGVDGLASSMGTLGPGATLSNNSFTATAAGLSGSPITFTAPILTPVAIMMIRAPDAYYFDVYYTKTVVVSEAENEANYSVVPPLEVILVERLSDTSYRVHTSRQTESVAYTVTITGIHDLDGLDLT
jgi:hypothetical protein